MLIMVSHKSMGMGHRGCVLDIIPGKASRDGRNMHKHHIMYHSINGHVCVCLDQPPHPLYNPFRFSSEPSNTGAMTCVVLGAGSDFITILCPTMHDMNMNPYRRA